MSNDRQRILAANEVRDWDEERDVVVVGTGVAGFSAALTAATRGLEVTMLERHHAVGGTSRKAGAIIWIPNNRYLREQGVEDPKDDFIRLLARIGRPLLYAPDAPRYGLVEWEYDLIDAYWENASAAHDYFAEQDILQTVHIDYIPTYNDVPEDRVRFGRCVGARLSDGEFSGYWTEAGDETPALERLGDGEEFMRQMVRAATRLEVPVRTGHRVTGLYTDEAGAVCGVRAEEDGTVRAIRARRAVVFASGGFTHDDELSREYLGGRFVGGCAAVTNQGDFVRISRGLGLPLVNMENAYMAPVQFERALRKDPTIHGVFVVPGDSMIIVNRRGQRFSNEKTMYNDRTWPHFVWDPVRVEYPNYYAFPIWDQRCADRYAGTINGNFIPLPGEVDDAVLTGRTLGELSARLAERLTELAESTSGFALDPDFLEGLTATVERYAQYASNGHDPEYHRGETSTEQAWTPLADDNTQNSTMFPFSAEGPYYATILAPGSIETKGGPRANRHGQVLDASGEPVPGLYGVGNCVGSPQGQAYWSAGATFGPHLGSGYAAALAVSGEPVRTAERSSSL